VLAETKGIIISFWYNDGSKGGCWVGIYARGLKGTDVVCESFEKLEEERKEAAESPNTARTAFFSWFGLFIFGRICTIQCGIRRTINEAISVSGIIFDVLFNADGFWGACFKRQQFLRVKKWQIKQGS
jgi:hypothetical protein